MAFVHPSRSGFIPQEPSRRDDRDNDRRRGRTRSRTPPRRDRHEDSHSRADRRGSPSYNDYKRPQTPPKPPANSNAPWRAEGSMYPPRRPGGAGPGFQPQEDTRPMNGGGYRVGGNGGGGYRGSGGADWLERYSSSFLTFGHQLSLLCSQSPTTTRKQHQEHLATLSQSSLERRVSN